MKKAKKKNDAALGLARKLQEDLETETAFYKHMSLSEQVSPKPYNTLFYVENSTPILQKFDTMEEMGKFVAKFQKKYPDHMSIDSGNWIDYVISDVRGDVHFFTDGIVVK